MTHGEDENSRNRQNVTVRVQFGVAKSIEFTGPADVIAELVNRTIREQRFHDPDNHDRPEVSPPSDKTPIGNDSILLNFFVLEKDTVRLRESVGGVSGKELALIFLLGRKVLLGEENILATKLTRDLRASGIEVLRLDRWLSGSETLVEATGARRSRRYRLKHAGEENAWALLASLATAA